jgi:hypothetical protein
MKYLFIILIILVGTYMWFSHKQLAKDEAIIQRLEDSLSQKIDTLIVDREVVKDHYIKSKEIVYKIDKRYVAGKDSVCDSLVGALKNSLKNCDKVVVKSDTLIKTLLVRDTVRVKHIQYLQARNKFSLIAGPTLSFTPQGLQPGVGIAFGIKIK